MRKTAAAVIAALLGAAVLAAAPALTHDQDAKGNWAARGNWSVAGQHGDRDAAA